MSGQKNQKIGLACAGGAIEGAAYEIGAMCALDEALEGISFSHLDIYVGVSAGAFITACLANHISPQTLSKAFISRAENVFPITPKTFFTPALNEYRKRLLKIPELIGESVLDYILKPFDISLAGSLFRLTSAIPVGLFDNESIRDYLAKNFSLEGRTDDFRKLDTTLRIVATNLESGEVMHFGESPDDKIPISKAVQASTALPILYMPVEIDGEYYIDGVARRTVHASVALNEGADLVFCLNPIVPVDAKQLKRVDEIINKSLIEQGLPSVLSQTFRMMIHSRMVTGFRNYEFAYPDADLVVIEPKPTDFKMFYTNIFSFSNRKEVCEYAYQSTRRNLLEQADKIIPKLEKYGITLRTDILEDESRFLYHPEYDHRNIDSVHEAMQKIDGVLSRLDQLLDKAEKAA